MEDDHSASGSKRSFEDDENDISVSKKCRTCTKVDEEGVAAAAMIVSLTESLQNCEDKLASCQSELESAKTEIDKWNSAFKKESFVPCRKSPEPEFVIDYIQTLRSSEKSLKEELEIAQMKLAIRDLKSQLKPAVSMKAGEDPAVDSEQQEEPDIESLKTVIEDQFRVIQTQNSHIQTMSSQIQTQNGLFKRFSAFFGYLAAKDPQLAILLRGSSLDPENNQSGTVNDLAGNNDSKAV